MCRHGTVTRRSENEIQVAYTSSSLQIVRKWLSWEEVPQVIRLSDEVPQVGRTMRRRVNYSDDSGKIYPAVVVQDVETGVTVEYNSAHSALIQRRFVPRKDVSRRISPAGDHWIQY